MTKTWLLMIGAFATVAFATIVLVVIPQTMLMHVTPAKELRPYSATEARGRDVYVANGCVYCHSQQIRDPAFTPDVDRGWGTRATVPADYAYDRPHLLGTSRTGPDLINVGQRLPDANWHLIHLYDPRAVTPWSIMPAFHFLFETKNSRDVRPGDRVVPVTGSRAPAGMVVVAKPDAVALVAYLLSLKREYPVALQPAGSARNVHTMP